MTAFLTAALALLRIVGTVLLELATIVFRFITTPVEQIPSKLIAIALAGAVGFIGGDFRGRHEEKAAQVEREAEHADAMEQLRESAAEDARAEVKDAQDKEQADAADEAKRIETYAQTLPRSPSDDCRIGDADLRAAGVQDHKHGRVRGHPAGLQRGTKAGAAR